MESSDILITSKKDKNNYLDNYKNYLLNSGFSYEDAMIHVGILEDKINNYERTSLLH